MSREIPGIVNGAFDGLVADTAFEQRIRTRSMAAAVAEYKHGVARQDVTVVHHKWAPLITGAFLEDGTPATAEGRKALMEKSGLKPMFTRNPETGEYEETKETYNGDRFKTETDLTKTQECMEKAHPPIRIVKPMPLQMLTVEEQPVALSGEFSV